MFPRTYINLGLPSGTLWAEADEPELHSCRSAHRAFGDSLPTARQLNELRRECGWVWEPERKGYTVTGPNGNRLFLPASGTAWHPFGRRNGKVYCNGSVGVYLSRTGAVLGLLEVWCLGFDKGGQSLIRRGKRGDFVSVRLVKNGNR